MVGSCINLTKKRKLELGIDSTGYHLEDRSYYYRKRLGKACKTRKNIKLSIAIGYRQATDYCTKGKKEQSHYSFG